MRAYVAFGSAVRAVAPNLAAAGLPDQVDAGARFADGGADLVGRHLQTEGTIARTLTCGSARAPKEGALRGLVQGPWLPRPHHEGFFGGRVGAAVRRVGSGEEVAAHVRRGRPNRGGRRPAHGEHRQGVPEGRAQALVAVVHLSVGPETTVRYDRGGSRQQQKAWAEPKKRRARATI